jgi:hypothetical protein
VTGATIAQLVVGIGSLTSVVLAGLRLTYAPWVLLWLSHAVFSGYAILSGQPGFLLLNFGMMAAAVFNYYLAWRRNHSESS